MNPFEAIARRVSGRSQVAKGLATTKEVDKAPPRGGPLGKESVVHQLDALFNERTQLRRALDARREQVQQLETELGVLRDRRIKALPFDPTEPPADPAMLNSLQDEIDRKVTLQRDAISIQSTIEARLLAIETEIGSATQRHQAELGGFLTALYEEVAEDYMEKAPEVAELLLRINAVRRAMMVCLAGNSNGFRDDAVLPRCEPGNGATLSPLYGGGSRDETEKISAYTDAILKQLSAAGFRTNLR